MGEFSSKSISQYINNFENLEFDFELTDVEQKNNR